MISSTVRQGSLFYAAFGLQASLIKDDLLECVNEVLDDPALVSLVREALAGRASRSTVTGRYGMAPDRLLRACALKHIKNWSFRDLERELRASLLYRHFARFDEADVPRYATFSRNFALLSPELVEQIHARVVAKARLNRVASGRKMRTDTTVVESNIHYPTDSTLLQDGVRVLTRNLKRLAGECLAAPHVADHARTTKYRVLEIHRASKVLTDAGKAKLTEGYRKLCGIAQGVVRQAKKVTRAMLSGELPIVGNPLQVLAADAALQHFVPLVEKVIAQTKARVFDGNRHVQDKIVSLFEEHSEVIRKGKTSKPTEFGRLVRLDEVENGIVSGYAVQTGNPPDTAAWNDALDEHKKHFGRPPKMATGDRGFYSAQNERTAKASGVNKVALPARGKLSTTRATLQKERWFRRALRWRAGIEARIATLKHRFGMARAQYKGDKGFQRWVGWSIISHNLVSIARVTVRRQKRRDGQADNHSA